MKPRLVDVAREAGVSPKTVSNYVNGYPFMSQATTDKVKTAIDKLGYVPNRMARNLRTGRTGLIAMVVPDLKIPYFAELAGLVTAAADRRGVTVLIDQTDGQADRERRAVGGLGPQSIDGLIMSPLSLTGDEVVEAAAVPMVLLGERARPAGIAYVGVDNVGAAKAATVHLIESGRRRIAAIGPVGARRHGTASLRLDGYREALAEAGMAQRDDHEPSVREFSRSEGDAAMQQLLALPEPPDAVFCFNDLLAVGALAAIHRAGLRVPTDIAMVGWDDIPEAAYTWPPLTSVRPDKERLAEAAVDHLLRLLSGEAIDQPEVFVGYDVVARESSARA